MGTDGLDISPSQCSLPTRSACLMIQSTFWPLKINSPSSVECPAQSQAEKATATLTDKDYWAQGQPVSPYVPQTLPHQTEVPSASLTKKAKGIERCSHFCLTNLKKTSLRASEKGRALKNDHKIHFTPDILYLLINVGNAFLELFTHIILVFIWLKNAELRYFII